MISSAPNLLGKSGEGSFRDISCDLEMREFLGFCLEHLHLDALKAVRSAEDLQDATTRPKSSKDRHFPPCHVLQKLSGDTFFCVTDLDSS